MLTVFLDLRGIYTPINVDNYVENVKKSVKMSILYLRQKM